MRARVLGPLELECDGRGVPTPGGLVGKLLRLLLIHPNELMPSVELAARLWPDLESEDGEVGQRRLYVSVSRLRRFLGGDGKEADLQVQQRDGGYRLVAAGAALDVVAFEALAREAITERNQAIVEEALGLWNGEPYAGFEWSEDVRDRRHLLVGLREGLSKLGGDGGGFDGFPAEALRRVKYTPPRLAGSTILLRTRLLERLPQVGEGPVMAVIAPAGYGKSVLLNQWASSQDHPVAWVNLDESDDDPVRLWSGVVEAVGRTGVPALETGAAGTGSVEFIEAAARAFQTLSSPLGIVLEDYHSLQNPVLHRQMEVFLANLPSSVTVAISSRSPLPFSVARLIAAGHLRSLDARDLRLTAAEIAELLGETEREWAPAVWELTEGWPVAVRMVIALPPTERADALTAAVGEFLIDEILDTLPASTQGFLMEVSHLDSFTPALAQAVTGREDAGETIAWLMSHQLCVTADGSTQPAWMRLHPLVASELQARAKRSTRIDVADLHSKAARWFFRHGAKEEALRHAIAGRASDVVAATVSDVLVETALHQQAYTCSRWLTALDPEDVVTDKRAFAVTVCMAAVWARQEVRTRWIRARIKHEGGEDDLVLAFVEAFAALRGGRAGEAVELFEKVIDEAGAYAADFAPDLVPLVTGISFTTAVEARMYQGNLSHEDGIFADAIARVRAFAPDMAAWIHAWWAMVAYVDGAEDLAATMAEEHYQLRRRGETDRLTTRENSLVGALTSARTTNDEERLHRLAEGIEDTVDIHGRLGHLTGLTLASLLIAAIYRKAGDLPAAERHQERADRLIITFPDAGFLSKLADAIDGILRCEASSDVLDLLTDREVEVLTLLGSDQSTKQIARTLFISPNTVRNHLSSIYRKLGVKTRHQAVLRLAREGSLTRIDPAGEEESSFQN